MIQRGKVLSAPLVTEVLHLLADPSGHTTGGKQCVAVISDTFVKTLYDGVGVVETHFGSSEAAQTEWKEGGDGHGEHRNVLIAYLWVVVSCLVFT